MRYKRILVTGGAGFIGSAFIRHGIRSLKLEKLICLDLLTYAADLRYLESVQGDPRFLFVHGDIASEALVQTLCETHQIDAIVHIAAETHVDRSISSPHNFIFTNIVGTAHLLEVVRRLPHLHFHHVSTDEVYGSITEGHFDEHSPYLPNSPYAASKAASDHLVRAWGKTYGLTTTISHCSNNYGPCQHPEKFIPRMILSALQGKPLPVYGDGRNVRDWLFVDDHATALWTILERGISGETYDIGGKCEKKNIDLLHELLEAIAPVINQSKQQLETLITFVPDRPAHDLRYAIRSDKIEQSLGWKSTRSFEEGLKETIAWYVGS